MYIFSKIIVAIRKYLVLAVKMPTPICYIGGGKAKKAADILEMYSVKNVLVITGPTVMKLQLPRPMLDEVSKKGIKIAIYDKTKPDPTFDIVDDALKICKENHCQAIVAFGGGSVIDTAKVVSVAYTNNKSPKELQGELKVKKKGLPLIAIPTTAGTGSETTPASVISDTLTHKKSVIIDPKIVPIVAILDCELTANLPLSMTAYTAMDALTHALEAYVSKYATEETDHYCEIAVKLIYGNLEKVYNAPEDLDAREALLVASFYAGMALTRTYVGYVHAFAHSIGGKFGVSHGLANAVLLPHIMREYLPVCKNRFAVLAELTSVCELSDTVESKSKKFIDSIFSMNGKLGIPQRLNEFPKSEITNVRSEGFKECHGTYPVPKYFTADEADRVLENMCANDVQS